MDLSLETFVACIQRAVRAKDNYTAGHNQRVARYAANLASSVGLSAASIDTIQLGGVLHDAGKIGIPDAILLKPTTLDVADRLTLHRHGPIGCDICEPLHINPLALQIVRCHHERLDGSGYPDGLRGSQIPLEVQIVGIVDVVDALLTRRVYRSAMSIEDTWEILHEEATRGLHDKCLVEQCIRLMAAGQFFAVGHLDDIPEQDVSTPVARIGAGERSQLDWLQRPLVT
jgi:HD-GYP domain-containing protein (c-di-GMP phosphodiesterase class II)